MIPLHLQSTTVHVTAAQAERLVRATMAEWLPLAVPALRGRSSDDAVLAALS